MAFTTTTLSAAVGVNDTAIAVASATGFAAGSFVKVGDEIMLQSAAAVGTSIPVVRGQEGTYNRAHVATANVTVGLGSDFAAPAAAVVTAYPLAGRRRSMASYSAAGAVALPTPGTDAVAILNGTVALAMTLANPTKDMDGDILLILGNGKAAHTVTYTAGLGNAGASYDVCTFDANGQACLSLIAANAIWVPLSSPLSGTLTSIDIAIA